jgi:hypothetical protein
MGWTFYNSSGQQMRATADKTATILEMEAGSSTTAYVTPGRTHFHPGVAKAWVDFDGTGTLVARKFFNCEDVQDDGTGNYRMVWDTAFTSADYAITTWACTGSTYFRVVKAGTEQRAQDYEIFTRNTSDANTDANSVNIVAFGEI